MLFGGGQENGIRSGTLAVPLIAGMAEALEVTLSKRISFLDDTVKWQSELRTTLTSLKGIRLNGVEGVPYIVSFSCVGIKSEVLVRALEDEGIYVSSKSACSSKKEAPSRVLLAMNRNRAEAVSGIRISMGMLTTEQDITACQKALIKVIPTLQEWLRV